MRHHRNTGKLELKSEDFCSCLCNQDIPKHSNSNDIMMASSLTNQPYHQKLTTLQPRGFQRSEPDFHLQDRKTHSVMSPTHNPFQQISSTLQGINISHLGKRKIIFKMSFLGDMLVPWRVYFKSSLLIRNVWDFQEAKASLNPFIILLFPI